MGTTSDGVDVAAWLHDVVSTLHCGVIIDWGQVSGTWLDKGFVVVGEIYGTSFGSSWSRKMGKLTSEIGFVYSATSIYDPTILDPTR